MKDTQDNDTYIKIGEQWYYLLGTVSGKCHWGFKPGLRAPNFTHVPSLP